MSSGPRTMVDLSMCAVGAAPKVGYMNGSEGGTPLCHVGTFSWACSDSRSSLLIYLRTRRCLPLIERLEWRGGLFLDSVSMLFFWG